MSSAATNVAVTLNTIARSGDGAAVLATAIVAVLLLVTTTPRARVA